MYVHIVRHRKRASDPIKLRQSPWLRASLRSTSSSAAPVADGCAALPRRPTPPQSGAIYKTSGSRPSHNRLSPLGPTPAKSGTSPHNLILDATSFSVPPHRIASPSKSVYPRPISPYNKPVRPSGLAESKAGVDRAYVANAHSVWDILNGPATNEAMAELTVDGRVHTVDPTPFNPVCLAKYQ